MQTLTKNPVRACAHRTRPRIIRQYKNGVRVVLLATSVILIITMMAACGGSGSSTSTPQSATLAGNWQFTVFANPDPNYPATTPPAPYGLEGGFLLQTNGSVTGQAVYSVSNIYAKTVPLQVCNAGSATVTGTLSNQTVKLTYVAGSQTFSLMGMLSSDGSTMSGTYTATQGTAADGTTVCGIGTSQSGPQQWTAVLVPPITGPITGNLHSTSTVSGLNNQDFAVTGSLQQGDNIGASNATVTGTLSFLNPTTNLSDYPCLVVASVNGQISGNSVFLQIIDPNGSVDGQIGAAVASASSLQVNPATFDSVQGGYILHGSSPTYLLSTKTCPATPGVVNKVTAGDAGDICLGLGSATACQQPITLSPTVLTFPAQLLGSAGTTQTITLTNNSSSSLSGLTISFINPGSINFIGLSDFNGLPSYQASDTCVPETLPPSGTGSQFSLAAGASCTISVTFTPQQGCPWLPFGSPLSAAGAAPEYCPLPQPVQVTVNSPVSADSDTEFTVPITGTGLSAVQPSTPELDFGAEEQLNPPEASLPQMLSFTNNSANPVQILGRAPCTNPSKGVLTLPHPLLATSPVAGLQVVSNGVGSISSITQDGSTISYNCDSNPATKLPNFQISSDTCTGTLLSPQASCSLQVTYVPQPQTDVLSGLDYFLELNTLQCFSGGAPTTPSATNPCEIDSGRFPVELKANAPSTLRMSPSAGLDFGNQPAGKSSAAMTITLLNDPNLTTPQTVTFVGQISVSGNYSQSNDCPVTLAPGSSCTLTVTFKPGSAGFLPGKLTINYLPQTNGSMQQFIYLRGTGQ